MSQSAERATVVQIGMMRFGSVEVRLIRNRNRLATKNAVVFADPDAGPDRIDRFPDPVIISVNIDREQPQVFVKSALPQQVVDIFPGNKAAFRLQVVSAG